MNVKTFLFRFLVGILAFSLSIGVYFIWQKICVKTFTQPQVSYQPVETNSVVETIDSLPFAKVDISAEKDESEEYPFYPDGEFYTDGDEPTEFNDIKYISIETVDWKNASEENDYKPDPVIPTGFIQANKEFKLNKISIANRLISFESETINGISYKFSGEYPTDKNKNETEYLADLEGTLTKYKDSKKVKSVKLKLYVIGC